MKSKIFTGLMIGWWLTLLLIAAHGLGVGIGSYTRVVYLPAPSSQSSLDPTLAQKIESLRIQVDGLSEDAKRIDRLVTLLLAVSSLFAIALGLHSYFGSKQLLDTAEKDSKRATDAVTEDSKRAIKVAGEESKRAIEALQTDSQEFLARAKNQLEQFLEEIREKYPEMANLHANLVELIGGLLGLTQQGFTYSKLNDRQRQDTLMAESMFAGLEVFGLQRLTAYRSRITDMYRAFARFYSSKYVAEGSRPDWERGDIYFEKALQDTEPTPELLKDYGVHLSQIEAQRFREIEQEGGFHRLPPNERLQLERLRDQAESSFRASLLKKPDEAGALFGIGWVVYRKQDFGAAITWNTRLISLTSLSTIDRKTYLADAYRNRACCVWLQSRDSGAAFDDLEKSKEEATREGLIMPWKTDVKSDPDLQTLWAENPSRTQALFG